MDKRKLKEFLKLKVHRNKRTGQALVMLPKKKQRKLPKEIDVVKW